MPFKTSFATNSKVSGRRHAGQRSARRQSTRTAVLPILSSVAHRERLAGVLCSKPQSKKNPTMKSIKVLRNFFIPFLLAAGVFGAPAYAQINIYVGTPPPALQQEIVPVIAPGYIWAPGYWAWNGDRHIWVRGRTLHQREGYRWKSDRWDERGGHYYHTAGYWELDGHKPIKYKKEKKSKDHEDRRKHHGDKHDD